MGSQFLSYVIFRIVTQLDDGADEVVLLRDEAETILQEVSPEKFRQFLDLLAEECGEICRPTERKEGGG